MSQSILAVRRWRTCLAFLVMSLSAGACASLIGLDDYERVNGPAPAPGDGGAGAGGGGGEACTPGETEACYTGPAGTKEQGVCHGGTRSCSVDGRWGDCLGEVVPAEENCATSTLDEDCDGSMWAGDGDGDCACEPGTVAACYTGPSGTEGVGACHGGSWACNTDGGGYGACAGEVLPAMQEVCGDGVLDETCDGAACPGDVVWALAAGGTGAQYAYDVAVDSNGNMIVAGGFQGDFTIGATTFTSYGTDSFILKLDPNGALIWAKQLGGAGPQTVRSVAVDDNDNVYYAGYFEGSLSIDAAMLTTDEPTGDIDVFAGKLGPQGTVTWTSKFGTGDGNGNTNDQLAYGIAVNGEDNVMLTGAFNGTVTYTDPGGNIVTLSIGNANFDLFVARIGAGGAMHWFRSFGDLSSPQSGRKVAYGSAIHVVGDGAGTFDVGSTSLVNGTDADVLALSFDPMNGDPITAAHFGTNNTDARGLDVALDPGGDVLLTGYYDGTIDFGGGSLASTGQSRFVTRRSSTGQHLWSMGFPAATSLSSSTVGVGIAADVAGSVLLTGHFSGTTDLGGGPLTAAGTDIFLAKLDPNGSHLWSRNFGNAQEQYGVAVAADPTGHAVVVGNFLGQIDFGITTLASTGVSTLFVAKLAP